VGDDLVFLIQDHYLRVEIGDDHVAVFLVEPEVARRGEIIHDVDGFAVQREALQTFVGAVGNDDVGFLEAVIDGDTVRAIELSGFFALAAKSPNVLAATVVLIDIARAIAVTDIDVAVGRDGCT